MNAIRSPGGSPAAPSAHALHAWRQRAEQVARLLEHGLDLMVGLMILTMAAAIIWQVFARYVLASAPGWSEELSRYLMIWVTMVGGAAVLRSGGQMAVTALLDRLPRRWRPLLLAVRDLAMVVTLVLLMWWGWRLAALMVVQETASLQISKAWVYAALPAGAGLMLLMLVLARLAGAAFSAADPFHEETDPTS